MDSTDFTRHGSGGGKPGHVATSFMPAAWGRDLRRTRAEGRTPEGSLVPERGQLRVREGRSGPIREADPRSAPARRAPHEGMMVLDEREVERHRESGLEDVQR